MSDILEPGLIFAGFNVDDLVQATIVKLSVLRHNEVLRSYIKGVALYCQTDNTCVSLVFYEQSSVPIWNSVNCVKNP